MRFRLAVLLLVLICGPVGAQSRPQGESRQVLPRVPVVVVLVERLHEPGQRYVVDRRPGRDGGDLIRLIRGATAGDLSEAVTVLAIARAHAGDSAEIATTLRRRANGGRVAGALPWAHRVVRDLHSAAPKQVTGVGTARSVTIWLPSYRRP